MHWTPKIHKCKTIQEAFQKRKISSKIDTFIKKIIADYVV